MFIPKEQVDYIQAVVSIEDVVIASGYAFRGTGRSRGVESCPACGRDHSHIKINQGKNLFNCFSPQCRFSGNQFQWIMKVEGLSFPDAVVRVAAIGKIELETNRQEEQNIFESRKQKALRCAVDYYRKQSHDYLQQRGIEKEIADLYFVGYAPGGAHLKHYLNEKGFEDDFLLEIGLVRVIQEKKIMDRFYNAIIIPDIRNNRIHDLYGRSVDPKVKTRHMYLYGQKSLIGGHLVTPGSEILVGEAPIDIVSGFQLTGTPGFSTGGAGKFDNWHIYQIKQQNLKPIIVFDNDEAGQAAAVEAVELLQAHGIEAKVITKYGCKDLNLFLNQDGNLLDYAMDGKRFVYEYQLSIMPVNIIEEFLNKQRKTVNLT